MKPPGFNVARPRIKHTKTNTLIRYLLTGGAFASKFKFYLALVINILLKV